MTEKEALEKIRGWMKESPLNTSIRLSAELGFKTNAVYFWLKGERIWQPNRNIIALEKFFESQK